MLGIQRSDIASIVAKESAEIERRLDLYRGNRQNPQVAGKVIILVDDGLATGVTATAAARALRLGKPKRLILAVPICASDSARKLQREVDELVCLHKSDNLMAVGTWYEDFAQLTDQEVIDTLARAHREIQVKV